MTRTASYYADAATDALNAGFTSKAAQKEALADLSRAYDIHMRRIQDALLADRTIANWDNLYWGKPGLHCWKAKHAALFAAWPEEVALIAQLVMLREAIKAAPITPPVRSEEKAKAEAVSTSIKELLERRGEQYNRALDLAAIFGRLPVTANVHLVTNEHGTTFLRAFYYLAGEFTPLNVILAAADKLARDEAAA